MSGDGLAETRKNGLETVKADSNDPLPFKDESIGVIVSTQVIERPHKCDRFVSEIHRVLKPDGYSILATEILASWHNVMRLVLGYQPLAENPSEMARIRNLSARNCGAPLRLDDIHVKTFTLFSFTQLLKIHNFEVSEVRCIGHTPLPPPISRMMSRIDKKHSRYVAT